MNDLKMAVESLEDELEGIMAYRGMLDVVESQELKKIVHENMQAERIHVQNLLKWINAETQRTLG